MRIILYIYANAHTKHLSRGDRGQLGLVCSKLGRRDVTHLLLSGLLSRYFHYQLLLVLGLLPYFKRRSIRSY